MLGATSWRSGRGRVVAAAGFVIVVFGEDDVPAVEAVLAAVGHDLAFLPQRVLGFGGEEEAASTAVDAHDLR